MDATQRTPEFDDTYARLQDARSQGDHAAVDQLRRELAQLAPERSVADQQRISPARTRRQRNRRVAGIVAAMLSGGMFVALVVSGFGGSTGAVVIATVVGAVFGVAIMWIAGTPEPDTGPIGGISYMAGEGNG
jgi:ferric-dicitrate binding protein FerR (iron transport regulator)